MTPPPAPPIPATRERILVHLQENRVTTAQALSRMWGLTRADIRYHLNTLLEEGIIELVPRDPSQPVKRGRPAQQYRLANQSIPDNFAALSGALLAMLFEEIDAAGAPEQLREKKLRRLAKQLAGEHTPAGNTPPGAPLMQRFNQAAAYLTQHGYRARWEAHASGPRILLRNCPYAALLNDHPELCELDRCLLEQLLQMPLRQAARMNLSSGKPANCIFSSQ